MKLMLAVSELVGGGGLFADWAMEIEAPFAFTTEVPQGMGHLNSSTFARRDGAP
jgi:hypothetical protein